MVSPYAAHKTRAFFRGLIGTALMILGVNMTAPCLSVGIVLLGAAICATSFIRVIRIRALEQRLLAESRAALHQSSKATLPRQLFWLLLGVAEVTGRAEQEQLELVRQMLRQRFTGVTAIELEMWEFQKVSPEQIGLLALQLRRILTDSECETIFSWCCLITFADQTFTADEQNILRRIARGLGLEQHHARAIFHQAKALFLGEEERQASEQERQRQEQQRRQRQGTGWRGGKYTPPPRQRRTQREQALEVLGLDDDASDDLIRKRHRELVKRHHPDAHAHLGPVAAEEAHKRFLEIQTAYERLGGT